MIRTKAATIAGAIVAITLISIGGPAARGAPIVWNLAAGGTWNAGASWNPATIPTAIGDNATFNNAASGSNPAQSGNRTVTLDGTKTVGSVIFNNDAANAFTNSVTTGTGGPLVFDETGAGPATINLPAAVGTGNNTISVAMRLDDNLVATVDQITATSGTGALNLTAAISGVGGFTKSGDGLATFGTGAKTYTGATVISGGRLRSSLLAAPTTTSSFTISAGGQLTLISTGTYAFGNGPLNLNGAGPTTGPFSVFPGAIRNDTGLVATISNAVNLQSDTVLHVQATAGTGSGPTPTGSLTFTNAIGGVGKLTLTGAGSNIDQGFLILSGANNYSGGTLVAGGILQASGAAATFGTGNVTVDNATSPASIARLSILTGVTDAIANTATLSLAGGGSLGVADQNYAILGTGINETIFKLSLGGLIQSPGTYGSTSSAATYQSDEYFSGSGILTVLVPEPSSCVLLFSVIAAGLTGFRGKRS